MTTACTSSSTPLTTDAATAHGGGGGPAVEIRGRPEDGRYVLAVDGVEGGSVEVRLRRQLLIVDHTEVDERFAGRGYGSRLVRHVLDDARARGLRIIPVCPFTARHLETHPEDRDLIDPRWAGTDATR